MPTDLTVFPTNIIDAVQTAISGTMTDYLTIDRPVRYTDPHQTASVYATDWNPGTEMEIGGIEPTINRYLVTIQLFLKIADERQGRRQIALDSKILRTVLYRDPTLGVAFATMSETLLGSVERFQRRGVQSQRFLNNEMRGAFVFLSTSVLWVETETMSL